MGSTMFEPELKTPPSFFQKREAQPEPSRSDKGDVVAAAQSEEKVQSGNAVSHDLTEHGTFASSKPDKLRTTEPIRDLDSLIQDVEHLVQELRRMKEEKLASEAELVLDQVRSFDSERNRTGALNVL